MTELRRLLARRLGGISGVAESESMFGHRMAYWANGKEIAHFESDEEIEIRLTRGEISARRPELRADPRITLRRSGSDWLAVRFQQPDDLDFVFELVSTAERAHRPPPGAMAKPPPTGPDLERRRRFH